MSVISQKMSFKDTEKDERTLDQLIDELKHQQLQNEFMGKDANFTLEQVFDIGGTYEASIRNMRSVVEVKSDERTSIHVSKVKGLSIKTWK